MALLSVVFSNLSPSIYSPVQIWLASAASPFSRVLFESGLGLSSFARGLFRFETSLDVERLEEELQLARNRIVRLENDLALSESRIEALEALRRVVPLEKGALISARVEKMIPARILAMDLSDWRRTILIGRGSSDGLEVGSPVMWAEAVVGRLTKVGPRASLVELITDPEFRLWVVDLRSRQQGILKGTGSRLAVISYVPFDADVKPGDSFVTTGLDGVFPPGLVAADVEGTPEPEEKRFLNIRVRPRVNLTSLENVIVLKKAPAPVETIR